MSFTPQGEYGCFAFLSLNYLHRRRSVCRRLHLTDSFLQETRVQPFLFAAETQPFTWREEANAGWLRPFIPPIQPPCLLKGLRLTVDPPHVKTYWSMHAKGKRDQTVLFCPPHNMFLIIREFTYTLNGNNGYLYQASHKDLCFGSEKMQSSVLEPEQLSQTQINQ